MLICKEVIFPNSANEFDLHKVYIKLLPRQTVSSIRILEVLTGCSFHLPNSALVKLMTIHVHNIRATHHVQHANDRP